MRQAFKKLKLTKGHNVSVIFLVCKIYRTRYAKLKYTQKILFYSTFVITAGMKPPPDNTHVISAPLAW